MNRLIPKLGEFPNLGSFETLEASKQVMRFLVLRAEKYAVFTGSCSKTEVSEQP
jgi:hypothetical protein